MYDTLNSYSECDLPNISVNLLLMYKHDDELQLIWTLSSKNEPCLYWDCLQSSLKKHTTLIIHVREII